MSRPEIDADLAVIDAALRGEDDGSELALLVADVQASAPRMSPQLERRLEGIGAEPAPARGRPRWWLLAPAGGVAALVAGVIVLSVSRQDTTPDSTGAASTADTATTQGAHAPGAAAPQKSAPERRGVPSNQLRPLRPAPGAAAGLSPAVRVPAPAAPSGALAGPRHVVHDVSLTLAASRQDFADVSDGVIQTTDRFGGIVQRSNVEQQGGSSTADFDLRIPTQRLDDALAALSRLAHVRARSAGTEDVTGAYNAAVGRLADARAERRALLRALARATTDAQVVSLRARLREVRERIGRGRRALDALRRRTNLARLSVSVVTARGSEATPPGDGHWTPRDALRDAGRVLEFAAGAVVVGLAALAPVALLAALLFAGTRAARRRRREAALG